MEMALFGHCAVAEIRRQFRWAYGENEVRFRAQFFFLIKDLIGFILLI